MPRTIVITGGGRNVGKTTVAGELSRLFSNSKVAKIGTADPKIGRNELYLKVGADIKRIHEKAGVCDFLVIESGSILEDPEFHPDLVIFLPAGPSRDDKPESESRRRRADIVRGVTNEIEAARIIGLKLGIDFATSVKAAEVICNSNTRTS